MDASLLYWFQLRSSDGERLPLCRFHAAVAQLKVDGVVSGATSRAYIDGRFVKQGEIINRALGLRFAGVDADAHMLLFTNADNVTFRKRY